MVASGICLIRIILPNFFIRRCYLVLLLVLINCLVTEIHANYPWYYGAEQYYRKKAKVSTKKCSYSLVINEVKAQDCPQIMQKLQPHTRHSDIVSDNINYNDEIMQKLKKLNHLEKKLFSAEKRMETTEALLKAKLMNASKQGIRMKNMEKKMQKYQQMLRNMEQKMLEVMVNVGEVNIMLDKRLPTRGHLHSKKIDVESAPKVRKCQGIGANYTNLKDCQQAFLRGHRESGVYYITPLYAACPIPVWCDMETPGGGWTVLSRRMDGSCSFFHDWKTYRNGFCDITREFWLGNDNIFLLSQQDNYRLRVDLWDFKGSRVYAEYEVFYIDGERDNYRLHVGNYSGTAGDAFAKHNNIQFSTADRDNDAWDGYHCAKEWHAGWWYNNCWFAYLTGPYFNHTDVEFRGISWNEWKHEQLMKAEMKITPILSFKIKP
ncbi:fibrinogen-like protein 1 [Tubulanus polymorphus]|uniref:fibrinogen-like protein 1 n=1 Tax=Tubulanus polymorphus TaxID=672921 RepID=UPI003DA31119